MIRVGIPTGRLIDHVSKELRATWTPPISKNRQLSWSIGERDFFALRPKVMPSLVAHGILDEAYCGSDSLDEFLMPELLNAHVISPQRGVRMVAASAQPDLLEVSLDRPLIVGTPYPITAARYMAEYGKAHIVVEQPGCSEGLCPKLVDLIIDVVETGRTLKDNGLVILEELSSLNLVKIQRKL